MKRKFTFKILLKKSGKNDNGRKQRSRTRVAWLKGQINGKGGHPKTFQKILGNPAAKVLEHERKNAFCVDTDGFKKFLQCLKKVEVSFGKKSNLDEEFFRRSSGAFNSLFVLYGTFRQAVLQDCQLCTTWRTI